MYPDHPNLSRSPANILCERVYGHHLHLFARRRDRSPDVRASLSTLTPLLFLKTFWKYILVFAASRIA
jgi:hypothetical protein